MLLIALMRGKQNGNKNRKEIWTLLLFFLNDLDTTRGQEEKENKKEPPPLDKRRKKRCGIRGRWILTRQSKGLPVSLASSAAPASARAQGEAATNPCPSTCALAVPRRVHIGSRASLLPVHHARISLSPSLPLVERAISISPINTVRGGPMPALQIG